MSLPIRDIEQEGHLSDPLSRALWRFYMEVEASVGGDHKVNLHFHYIISRAHAINMTYHLTVDLDRLAKEKCIISSTVMSLFSICYCLGKKGINSLPFIYFIIYFF